MKKIPSKVIRKCGEGLTKAVLAMGKDSAIRSCCFIFFYQPKVPRGMEKFKK